MKRCHWFNPVMICQVKFTEWTRDDRHRQPVFLGIKEDENANEVVREKPSLWNPVKAILLISFPPV
jgi:bifunctional non-homologous end joining protein LigD